MFFPPANFQVKLFSEAHFFGYLIKIFIFTLLLITASVSHQILIFSIISVATNLTCMVVFSFLFFFCLSVKSQKKCFGAVTAGKAGGVLYFEQNKAEETL